MSDEEARTGAELEQRVRVALSLNLPYPERPGERRGTLAAVLVLLAHGEEGASLLVTRRADTVGTHKGQMAFPGGHCEEEEKGSEEGAIRAALRETEEEIGIPPAQVKVLGTLPGLWTVSGFWITPVVGILEGRSEEARLRLDPSEIAEAIWVPVDTLHSSEVYRKEFIQIGQVNYPIHVFQVGRYRIWGATGSMIRNLLDRFGAIG